MYSSDDDKYDSDERYSDNAGGRNVSISGRSEAARLYEAQTAVDRRPLIDRVTNRWQDEPEDFDEKHVVYQYNNRRNSGLKTVRTGLEWTEQKVVDIFDLDNDASCMNVTYDVVVSPRFRRAVFGIIASLVLFIIYWTNALSPFLRAEWVYKEGFVNQEHDGTYGIATGGDWKHNSLKIAHISHDLVPGGEADAVGEKRLIFVGDIHGCLTELKALEEKVGFREGVDTLIAVGDVLSKGPDSVGVLDELIRINAITVRGNHEDRILEAARFFSSTSPIDPPTAEESTSSFAKDAQLLKSMKKHHLRYLQNMPLILRVPALPFAHSEREDAIRNEILVVHAGLVPRVGLRKQDPYYVMNMRSIHLRTHAPSATHADKHSKTKPWTELWNWYNDRLYKGRSLIGFRPQEDDEGQGTPTRQQATPEGTRFSELWHEISGGKARPSPQVVVYGHDSKLGLNLNAWSKGLDTACVKGGQLTAMVLVANGDTQIEAVECEVYR
ncbi:Metallo-dependent phosphatase [Polychaeton citri CBS 116435]|uniref:Metallo-dependent phosphatase n=1 Tax=Polychaeton citri CBS 116435 TaxID=1314669 RepID=A0A9P4Q6S7_9PEZI|nr:Metallo-dependent phosphatase [Polychaeton citri CBS 116435]